MTHEEWIMLRWDSIGGSETGVIMGLDDYKCSGQLYEEKIGVLTAPQIDNQFMFWGRELEEKIADVWQYWENDIDQTVYNKEHGLLKRKCRKSNKVLYHPEHDHISANVDRVIQDRRDGRGQGILEIKTISGFSSDKWETGIPPKYLIQLQHYLAVTGFQWGEIAVLKDGREFIIYEFERNEQIIKGIESNVRKFWERVEKGREAVANHEDWTLFEPEPDESPAWSEYLSEKFKKSGSGMIQGTFEQYELAHKLSINKNLMSEIKKSSEEIINQLKYQIKEFDGIEWEGMGKVTWKSNAKGVRQFLINIK